MASRIRVLQVTESTGGIQTYLEQLFDHIDMDRFEIALACPAGKGTLAAGARARGVEVFPVPLSGGIRPFLDLRATVILAQVIREFRPSVVHTHSSKGGVVGRLAALLTQTRCVHTPNAFAFLGANGAKRMIYRHIERRLRPLTHILVAASESERARAVDEVGFRPDKVRVVWNSISLQEVQGASAHRPPRPSFPNVGFVGRFVSQKNPEAFVRVAALVAAQDDRCRFRMIGAGYEGAWGDRVKTLMRELGIEERFDLVGWLPRDEALREMSRLDILVVPSRFESFGYVAAEASAMGIPVVAANVDGLKDVVVDRMTGFLVPPDNEQLMASRVLDLLADSELCRSQGIEGARWVAQQFDISRNIGELEAIYVNATPRSDSE